MSLKVQLIQSIIVSPAIAALLYGMKVTGVYMFDNYISPKLYTCISIQSSESEFYDAVLMFIQAQNGVKVNHITARLLVEKNIDKSPTVQCHKPPSLHYQPTHTGLVISMPYKGRVIYISKKTDTDTLKSNGRRNSETYVDTLSLSIFGNNNTFLKNLLIDAVVYANKAHTDQIRIYTPAGCWSESWSLALSKPKRYLDSVIMDNATSQSIIQDANLFMESQQWYETMGIPYRRGYLFHGPPGCGKTSLCQVIASTLQLDICMLSMSKKETNDSLLTTLIRNASARSIILLEDIDAVFTLREGKENTFVTFSGLLNALDGIASQEGKIFIMTTNHIEKLDPALIRPGRCDVKIRVNHASRHQLVAMFLRFFPDQNDHAQLFAGCLPADKLSMAQIQNHLIGHRHSAQEALETAPQILIDDQLI